MVKFETLRALALSFPEVIEEPHFEKTSFRVRNKIFATHDEKQNRACLKLSESEQDIFSITSKGIIYPVPNKWGKQGWTFVDFEKVDPVMFEEALRSAYWQVAPLKFKL